MIKNKKKEGKEEANSNTAEILKDKNPSENGQENPEIR